VDIQVRAHTKFTGNVAFAAVDKARGCAVARTGVGIYTLTMDEAITENDLFIQITEVSGVSRTVTCNVALAVLTLTVFTDAGAATDTFELCVTVGKVTGG
jgi:uncharacterized protein YbjT (DUF2867 family)